MKQIEVYHSLGNMIFYHCTS